MEFFFGCLKLVREFLLGFKMPCMCIMYWSCLVKEAIYSFRDTMNMLNLRHTNFLRTFSILTDCEYELVTDLTIVCHNGMLQSYQFLLSRMSPLLRRLFSSKLVMEDCGKRKAEVTLHLPDVDLETLKRAVAIFTEGVVNIPNQEESIKLQDCWTLLSIECPTLDTLKVI
mgnify:CR=1 FL=1